MSEQSTSGDAREEVIASLCRLQQVLASAVLSGWRYGKRSLCRAPNFHALAAPKGCKMWPSVRRGLAGIFTVMSSRPGWQERA